LRGWNVLLRGITRKIRGKEDDSHTPDHGRSKNGVPAQPVKLDVSRKLACDNVAAVLQGGELLTPVA
jgi:hypothetical protein